MLELRDVRSGYGAGAVLGDIDLTIRRGEAVALVGANGAGKSTVLKTVIGIVPLESGHIVFNGQDISALPPHARARLGIGYVPEDRRLFAGLTVQEHLAAARQPGAFTPLHIYRLFPDLGDKRHLRVPLLSNAQRQMLAIGRALTTNARLLLIDAATEGLAPAERSAIWRVLAKLKERGMSLLMVDKSVEELRYFINRFMVMDKGSFMSETPQARVLLDPREFEGQLHF